MAGALSLSGLSKRFADEVAVDDLSLDIGAGEFFSLLGSSGCGKTTTLRMVAGFERPDAGSIVLDGRDLAPVPAHKRPVNTVFQSYALFPFLTVHDNVAFGLRYTDAGKEEVRQRVGRALELVQLGHLAQRKPHQLSGGQQQRVALARALVLEPTVLLLDEPMGALDAKLRKQLQLELRSLQRLVGTTFVYVTHDQEEALTMSDRLAVLHRGRVMQVGTPSEVYSQPASAHVATFLGTANLYDAVVTAVEPAGPTCQVGDTPLRVAAASDMPTVGDKVKVMVRPERVEVCPPDPTAAPAPVEGAAPANLLRGQVETLTFRGAHSAVAVRFDALVLEAEVANVHGEPPPWLHAGGAVLCRVSPTALRILPNDP
jgi:spermidine/putrescine transport system ATP-binding protein